MIALFRIIEGLALLTLGRKLFWLFVGLFGFEAGMQFAPRLLPHQPEWLVLVVALILGVIGAVVAIFLQNMVIGVAGFVGGGGVAAGILQALNLDAGMLPLVAFIVGGIIGVILVSALFDWALIGLSSLAGALTLTNVFLPHHALALLAIVILFAIGVAIQGGWLWNEKRRT